MDTGAEFSAKLSANEAELHQLHTAVHAEVRQWYTRVESVDQLSRRLEEEARKAPRPEQLGETADQDDSTMEDAIAAQRNDVEKLIAVANKAQERLLRALQSLNSRDPQGSPTRAKEDDPGAMARCDATAANVTAGRLPCPLDALGTTLNTAYEKCKKLDSNCKIAYGREDLYVKTKQDMWRQPSPDDMTALGTSNLKCPDGEIGLGGMYVLKGGGGFVKGHCRQWGYVAANNQIPIMYYYRNETGITGDFVATKGFVDHPNWSPEGWGIVGYKRVRCIQQKCYVYKVARCFDLSSVGGNFSHKSSQHMTKNLPKQRLAFSKILAKKVLREYKDKQLPSKFDCRDSPTTPLKGVVAFIALI